ncbi:non-muscle caldesmon-like isoform X2 [Alosa sapidissima]|uniref:non-muscle caldesmon-like isoform X2 n=1 Tax=Alosa sapidissima TaxID=34773 RepID=UPI001C0A293C|nr:non-muscle caldesmon-like isoform X2 [Alosa sapidissima]
MSSSILRRNSSKQGLQNLQRITAQRSVEDAEEIERERRRRARQRFGAQNGSAGSGETQHSGGYTLEDDISESAELKPSHQSAMEEDEGFSDWTQRLEKRRQKRMEEHASSTEEDRTVPAPPRQNGTTRHTSTSVSILKSTTHRPLHNGAGGGPQEEEGWSWRRHKEQEDTGHRDWEGEEDIRKTGAKAKADKKPLIISYTSKLVLQHDVRYMNGNGVTDGGDVTSHMTTSKIIPGAESLAEDDEAFEAAQEREAKLQSIRLSHQQKEQQELDELRQKGMDAQQELEDLNMRREERRRAREEEERRREEEEQLRKAREEEERQRMREEIERRRMEATERRMKRLSTSSAEEEPFSPLSPRSPSFKNENEERVTAESTCSITERTESLKCSLKKSNSLKSAQPPVPIAKIDDRLEQYNQAIEISSKEAKAAKQALMEIPSPPEPVASKKSLFEAGDAWNQNASKTTPSKDAEELKVGVADLITKWAQGSSDGSVKTSPSKAAEVKPGDVLNKKNLWENLGDSPGNSGPGAKGTPCGKKYKFVKTRHGKYEKIAVDDEYTFEKSGEDL